MASKRNNSDRLYCAVCERTWETKKVRGAYQKQLLNEKICPRCGGLVRRESDHPTGEYPTITYDVWRY